MARKPAPPLDEPIPEADCIPGIAHPRHAPRVVGQDAAIEAFLSAAAGGRLHHAWLLGGPRGVGKATLAWAIARWLLAQGSPDRLEVDNESPVVRRILALSEPRLHLVRRPYDEKTKRFPAQIPVDEIRRLLGFFQLSSADGGRRVAIIDAADEMNPQAANALLKLLEEPPENTTLLLVAHQPARLLPTIRSRCRSLRLAPLGVDAMAQIMTTAGATIAPEDAAAFAALSGGSAGEALRFFGQDGLAVYRDLVALFAGMPRMDRVAANRVATAAGGRATGGDDPFDLTVTLLDRLLSRLVRSGLEFPPHPEAAPNEAAIFARICSDAAAARRWADAHARLSAQARSGRAVNLDPAALVMDMLMQLARVPTGPG